MVYKYVKLNQVKQDTTNRLTPHKKLYLFTANIQKTGSTISKKTTKAGTLRFYNYGQKKCTYVPEPVRKRGTEVRDKKLGVDCFKTQDIIEKQDKNIYSTELSVGLYLYRHTSLSAAVTVTVRLIK